MSIHVTSLHVHPVKSMAGISLERSEVDDRGLVADRRFAVVTPFGAVVTAREVKDLLGLRAEPAPDGIRILDRDGGVIEVEEPFDGPEVPVGFRGMPTARDAGDEVAAWISERIRADVRLVWQQEDSVREVSPGQGGLPGDLNSLADAAPILLTTQESLARVNAWMRETDPGATDLVMERFRPNIVVAGADAFAEDDWDGLTIGGVRWRRTMVCDRCGMTLVDPTTLDRGQEPIRTLSAHRNWEGNTWFGIRLVPELEADVETVSVGDELVPD